MSLRRYGRGRALFADNALRHRIADNTPDVPRRINQLRTAALISAAVDRKKIVDDTTMRMAINDSEQD